MILLIIISGAIIVGFLQGAFWWHNFYFKKHTSLYFSMKTIFGLGNLVVRKPPADIQDDSPRIGGSQPLILLVVQWIIWMFGCIILVTDELIGQAITRWRQLCFPPLGSLQVAIWMTKFPFQKTQFPLFLEDMDSWSWKFGHSDSPLEQPNFQFCGGKSRLHEQFIIWKR